MSLARFARRKDGNQAEIVDALRDVGVDVWPLDVPCDLLCGYRGALFTVEVKDGSLPPSRRALTPAEITYAGICAVKGYPHYIVKSVAEALQIVGVTYG